MSNLDLASQAFDDLFTQSHGNTYFVSVEPVFDEQITEAVTLIARSRPENVRQSYISQFTTAAKLAVPTPEVPEVNEDDEEESDEDKEEEKKETPVESEEQLESKRKVVKDLLGSIRQLRLEGTDKEFEGFSNLILSLILTLFDSNHVDFSTLLITLADAVMFHSPSEKVANPSIASRYTAVSTIFNSLPASPTSLKLTILIKLISYACANEDFTVIRPALERFESWLVEWGFTLGSVGEEEGNRAVLLVANGLSTREQKPLARNLILEHLSATSVVKGSSSTPSQSTSLLATQLIVLSLSLSDVFDFTLLSTLPSISSPSIPSLLTLLKIFQSGSVNSFDEFLADSANVAMLKEQNLDINLLKKKLKLLALTELCSSKVGEYVSYSEIAQALNLTIAEGDDGEAVETWVIDAIRATLISGRLSQTLLSFHVTRALPRSFTDNHWNLLKLRLGDWKVSIDGILGSVSKGLGIDNLNGAHVGATELVAVA